MDLVLLTLSIEEIKVFLDDPTITKDEREVAISQLEELNRTLNQMIHAVNVQQDMLQLQRLEFDDRNMALSLSGRAVIARGNEPNHLIVSQLEGIINNIHANTEIESMSEDMSNLHVSVASTASATAAAELLGQIYAKKTRIRLVPLTGVMGIGCLLGLDNVG
jgi:uncharacterized transporter YbjL